VTEGNGGTTDAILPIKLSGASTQSVSVDFTTVDGTATVADNDYIPASGTLTFAPGETSKTITVKVVGDTRYEYNDRFTVVLSNPVNATILGNHPGFSDTAQVVIVNDDAGTPLGITTTALPDGVTGVSYSFQLEGGGVTPLTWGADSLDPGLAVDPATGIISGTPIFPGTFSPGITLKDGGGFTASKILTLNVTGPGIPFLVFSNNPLDFGNVAVGSTSVSPRLVAVKNQGAVNLVLGSPFLTAIAGGDFTLATGSFACTAGQAIAPSSQCFIYFNFSPQASGPRTATVGLISNVAPAIITLNGNGTSSTTPTVSIANAASAVEGNTGTTPMAFNVTLSAASASSVTVHYAATGGTATSGVDYTLAGTGTLTFAPGTTTQAITVNVIGDTQPEPDETVVITLSSPTGATLGAAAATGIILNDDAGAPVLTLVAGSGNFGNQTVGTTSSPHMFTLANTGSANVVLATPFAAILSGTVFAIVSGPNACAAGSTLAPSATCSLYITFTPIMLGEATTTDALSSNAPDIVLTLDGVGVDRAAAPPAQPVPTLSLAALGLLMFLVAVIGYRLRRRV
jgi:chitinase